jgi:uncharacterized protein involved in type VI secretion and phage assembly
MSESLAQLIVESGSLGQGALSGIVVGVVTNNKDDDGLGRVKVKFPWLSSTIDSFWARLATPMAGAGRGLYFLPEVDDEVLITFERGDLSRPIVLGSLWNGKDLPPATNDDGANDVRLIRSRSGHTIKLNDADGKETVEVIDASGKNSIVIDTASNTVTVQSEGDLVLAAPRGLVRITGKTVEIESTAKMKLNAGADFDVSTPATLNIAGKLVNIN